MSERVGATSIVNSRLLAAMARSAGVAHRETLTEFTWISRVPGLVHGYEEALGSCLSPEDVRDEDGIAAALAVAELVAELADEGTRVIVRPRDTEPKLTVHLEAVVPGEDAGRVAARQEADTRLNAARDAAAALLLNALPPRDVGTP